MIDEIAEVIPVKNKGGRPLGSGKPIDLQELQSQSIIGDMKLAARIRKLANTQVDKIEEGHGGGGEVKLLESCVKNLEALARAGHTVTKQQGEDPEKDKINEDGGAILAGLLK